MERKGYLIRDRVLSLVLTLCMLLSTFTGLGFFPVVHAADTDISNVVDVTYEVFDENGEKVVPDSDGYHLVEGKTYKFKVNFADTDNKIQSNSTYSFKLPAKLCKAETIPLTLDDGTEFGTMTVDEEGNVVIKFNENAGPATNKTFSYAVDKTATADFNDLKFGDIKIKVKEPDPSTIESSVKKDEHFRSTDDWKRIEGNIDPTLKGLWKEDAFAKPDGKGFDGEDYYYGTLHWRLQVQNTDILGKTFTDTLNTIKAGYTESTFEQADRNRKILVRVTNTVNGDKHWFVIEPHYDSNKMTFMMPNSVAGLTCIYHGKTFGETDECCNFQLKQEYKYEFYFTSTIAEKDRTDFRTFYNTATFPPNSKEVTSTPTRKYGDKPGAHIVKNKEKNGSSETYNVVKPDQDGNVHWWIEVTLPASNGKEFHDWYFKDEMLFAEGDTMSNATVKENFHDIVNEIKSIEETSDNISNIEEKKDTKYVYQLVPRESEPNAVDIHIYSKCHCTEGNCFYWKDGNCGEQIKGQPDYCECWQSENDVTFRFEYTTTIGKILEAVNKYNNLTTEDVLGALRWIRNEASLRADEPNGAGGWSQHYNIDRDYAWTELKDSADLFSKTVSGSARLHYTITINESKLNLPSDQPIVVKDTMDDEHIRLDETSVLLTRDGEPMQKGTDYDFTYDGHKNLTVTINSPGGQHTYVLTYEVDVKKGTNTTLKNTATVTLFEKKLTVESDKNFDVESSSGGTVLSVDIKKIEKDNPNKKLAGAEFNVYPKGSPEKVYNATTDGSGIASVTSFNVSKAWNNGDAGFVYHKVYCIKETKAPEGYKYSDTVYEFYFCNCEGGTCKYAGEFPGAQRIGTDSDGYLTSLKPIPNEPEVGSLKIEKTVKGKESVDTAFNFTVKFTAPAGKTVVYKNTANLRFDKVTGPDHSVEWTTDNTLTFTLKDGEFVTIDNLPVGTTYEVTEDSYAKDGYETSWTGETSGTISTGTESVALTCTNTYAPEPIKIAPRVEKKLNGSEKLNGRELMFTFELKAVGGDGTAIDSVLITNAGEASFKELTFTEPDKYRYTITEATTDKVSGVTYDESVWTLEVNVVDKDGNLVPTVTYYKDNVLTDEVAAVFTNTYNTGSLEVKKTVTGSEGDKNKEFNFTLTVTLPSDATLEGVTVTKSGTSEAPAFNGNTLTFTLKDGETLTVEGLPFGTTYTVTETDANTDGYTTSNSGKSGTISGDTASVEVEITNDKPGAGAFTPKVKKEITGQVKSDEEFTFTLTPNDGAPMPGVEKSMTVTVTGSGEEFFNTIKYSTAGEYTYTITETSESKFFDKDNAVWTLTVTVAKDGENLKATGVYTKKDSTESSKDAASFTNERKTGGLTVKKTVTDDGDKSKAFHFTVTLSDRTISGTYGEGGTAMTFNDGVANFELKDGESKTATGLPAGITYTVTETEADQGGYTTTITDNDDVTTDGKGTIEADATDTVEFTNDYKPTEATYTPKVEKTIAGDTPTEDVTFTFTLTAEGDAPMPEIATAEVTLPSGAPTAEFGEITYEKAGTYRYRISETNDDDANFTCDKSTWTLEVVVEDVDDDGELDIKSITYTKNYPGDKNETAAKFTNVYKPTETTYTPQVEKTIAGDTPTENVTFTFTLTAVATDGIVPPMPADETAKVTLPRGSKTAQFGEITFDKAGTYKYTIKENAGEDINFDYDGSTWTLTVEVEDVNGVLVATGVYAKNGVEVEGATFASFTNTYTKPKLGSLSVTKTVTGDGDTSKEWNFAVTLSDTTINGTYGTGDTAMEFTNGVAEFTLTHGQTKTATDLPADITYTVTEAEANADEYTTTSKNESSTIPDGGTAEVEFTNHREPPPPEEHYGNLSVTKTVTGIGDTSRVWNFTVTLGDNTINGTYGDMTFTGGVAEFTLTHGQTKTATGLPAGITYTVTETEANTGGYETSATGTTGIIPDGGTASAQFTNHREPPPPEEHYGNLSVTKTVTGIGNTSRVWNFTVTLTDTSVNGTYGDMTFENGVATFTLTHGQTKTATDLPADITYMVTEAEANADGYETSATGTTGIIPDGGTASARFTNHREPPPPPPEEHYGNLSVTKTVTGIGNTSRVWNFTVTLTDTSVNGTYGDMTFTDGTATFTLTHNQTKTATGLPADITYTVTEAEANAGGYETSATGTTGTIPDGGTAYARFTNHREPPPPPPEDEEEYGSLTIRKTVVGGGDEAANMTYAFTVSGPGGYENIVSVTGSGSVTLEDLIPGTYTVTEDDANITGWMLETTGTGNVTVTANMTSEVSVTNTYTSTVGGLTVTKTVTGIGDTTRAFGFTVTLSDETINGTYGGMTFVNGVAAFVLSHGESVTATGLPDGTGYTVSETGANSDGYITSTVGAASGTITAGAVSQVEFINDMPNTGYGSLSVTKTVTGAGDTTRAFNFTVTLSDATINGTYGDLTFVDGAAVFTLRHGETATAAGLPEGIGYTVTETNANRDGYITSIAGDVTGTITTDTIAAVEFINDMPEVEYGSLTVAKTVTGAGDTTREFNFTVTLSDATINGTYGDMTFVNGVASFTLRHGETATAAGLPAGTNYVVSEEAAVGYTTSSGGTVGAIPANDTAAAEFVNYMPMPDEGSLTVTKVVSGNASSTAQQFTFVITLSDAAINGTYGDMTFENGVATVMLRHGETATASGLPADIDYTVVELEANTNNYMTYATGDTGTILSGGTAQAMFINRRNVTYTDEERLGTIVIRKRVTGSEGELDRVFHFTLTLTDRTVNGTYGDLTFENGVAEFTLRSGENIWGRRLPIGVGYTVTELEANYDGYETTSFGSIGTITEDTVNEVRFDNHRGGGDEFEDFDEWEELFDPDIPLSDFPFDDLDDWDIPLSDLTVVSETGDISMHTGFWMIAMTVSLTGIILMLLEDRRKRGLAMTNDHNSTEE